MSFKLLCAFVDFNKSFDGVLRSYLCTKIVEYNVLGKLLNVIRNMYKDVKYCLKLNNGYTDFFVCGRGVTQGAIVSLVLFSFIFTI